MAKDGELDVFKEAYRRKKFTPATFQKGQTVGGFIGIDGGSTSTKAVLLDDRGEILCKAYQLSNGNPIQDTIEMFENLRGQVEAQNAKLEVLGVATTGYAKDILKDVLHADVALVETVAHTESALKFYEDPHVIVDVGGQDIKIIILHNGRVKDFKLNTQCSAGNGYFLQSTAEGFGLGVEQYADLAFSAKSMPVFGYGCAVFMQSDIVNFQRQGWRAEEILAGLAAVLPKNVFLYVASIPNLAALGTRFVLQGGTQNNMAVVKAEVDFIQNSFRAAGKKPEIIVHEFCGESGAIGAAAESLRLWRNGQQTTFVGLDAVRKIKYRTTRNEETRCHFCKNDCLRTFIDIRTAPTDDMSFIPIQKITKVPLMHGEQRLIISTCEKGQVEDVNDMKDIKAGLDEIKGKYPNFVDFAAREVFRPVNAKSVADPIPSAKFWNKAAKERIPLMEKRKKRARGHSTRAQHLHLCTAFQRISGKSGGSTGEHRLLRLHEFGALSGGSEPRRHRSLLPGEDRHFARLQPDSGKAPEETARRNFLPDVRRADIPAGQDCGRKRMPDCHRDARNREGRIHERE